MAISANINNSYNNIVNFKNTDNNVTIVIDYTGADSAYTYKLTYTADGTTYVEPSPSVTFTNSTSGTLSWTIATTNILNSLNDNENFKIKLTSIETPVDTTTINSRARIISMNSGLVPSNDMTVSDIINLVWNNVYTDNEYLNIHFSIDSGSDTIYKYNNNNLVISNRTSFPFVAGDPTNNINMPSGGSITFTLQSTTDYNYKYTFTAFTILNNTNTSQWKIQDDNGSGTMDRFAYTERYELGSRVAGEKALYGDEFITLGQIELGTGLKGYHREDDGTISGKDTVAKYYAARNLLLELDSSDPLFDKPQTKVVDISTLSGWQSLSGTLSYGTLKSLEITHNFGLTNISKIQVEIKEKDLNTYTNPNMSSMLQWEPLTNNTIRLYYVDKSSIVSGDRFWTIKIVEIL